MQRSHQVTRTRRRALAVPFVVTMAAAMVACGSDAAVRPAGDPVTTNDVISNPATPDDTVDNTVVSANPAPPEPETPEPVNTVVIANPAEPEPDNAVVIANPAPPQD